MFGFVLFTLTVSFCFVAITHGNGIARKKVFMKSMAINPVEDVADVNNCPCTNPDWCKPITSRNKTEVFAFSLRSKEDVWQKYGWTKVTTIAQVGYINVTLVCLAHSHNTRVVTMADVDLETMVDEKERRAWVKKLVKIVTDNFLDGVNFDFEGPIGQDQTDWRDAYTQTVLETSEALKAINPLYQISVDVAWKPNVDSRFYDYKNLGKAADLLFVMAYDEQSQIYGECVSMPNSGLEKTQEGLSEYLTNPEFQVDPNKLVLGVPWYGYGYACMELIGDKCLIHEVPFRGVPCSDAAGKQYDFVFIRTLLKTVRNKPKWNKTSSTPFVTYEESPGVSYQMQFDDLNSLTLKYDLAKQKGLRGVGMWNIDNLDYTNQQEGEEMRRSMFGALP